MPSDDAAYTRSVGSPSRPLSSASSSPRLMMALMDATGCRVSRPREDAARGEWQDGEERRTPAALAFEPETFYPIPSSSPHAIISHHLLRSSSASVPVVYSISSRPSLFPTFSPPLSTAVSLAPPPSSSSVIVRIQTLSFSSVFCFRLDLSSSSSFIIRLRFRSLPNDFSILDRISPSSSPVIARLSSRSLPVIFSIPDHRLRFRPHLLHSRLRLLNSRPPSPFPLLYSTLVRLRSHSLPPIFSCSDESHTSSGYARAAALARGQDQAREYLRPSVGV
ncbi:hypothetical protein ACLOJK_022451 [Asimina triloba]